MYLFSRAKDGQLGYPWKDNLKLDPVGSTVRYEVMKLFTGSVLVDRPTQHLAICLCNLHYKYTNL